MEHEVSVVSAKNIIAAINKDKYEVIPIGVDRVGRMIGVGQTGLTYLENSADYILDKNNPPLLGTETDLPVVTFSLEKDQTVVVGLSESSFREVVDVVFPIIHGTFGEDGCLQGLLKMVNLPFVGCGVLGSAVNMDKDVEKRLLRDAGIPIASFAVFHRSDPRPDFEDLGKELGPPLFVKPVCLGSSVGIKKVSNAEEFDLAVAEAFAFDNKIIIEEGVIGREFECSVLGNEHPTVSTAGEIIPAPEHGFYSYDAKYIDEKGAALKIPAEIPDELLDRLQELALRAYQATCCSGMARVDFLMDQSGRLVINELNTLPGFTNISMYPKLWEASGIAYSDLIDQLIQLGIEQFQAENSLTYK